MFLFCQTAADSKNYKKKLILKTTATNKQSHESRKTPSLIKVLSQRLTTPVLQHALLYYYKELPKSHCTMI